MSLSSLRITGGHRSPLLRVGALKRLTLILLFYLVLGCCGGLLVFAWYGLSGPFSELLAVISQGLQNPLLVRSFWSFGVTLEALLFFRGTREHLRRKYPLFYSFILLVLVINLMRVVVFNSYPSSYQDAFWATELLGPVAGCAVVFEICMVPLAEYPGIARLARRVLVIIFAVPIAKALIGVLSGSPFFAQISELKLNLMAVQAGVICVLVAFLHSYSRPLGKNLKGILFGYFLSIWINIITTLLPGSRIYAQIAWLLVLSIWVSALWSYQPRESEPGSTLERDYEKRAEAISARLRQVRHSIFRKAT